MMIQPLGPPVQGQWLALNPPGHPSHVYDMVRLDLATGRVATGGVARYLSGLLSAQDVHGWSALVVAPRGGVVVACHEPDGHRLTPLTDAPASFVRPLLFGGRLERVAGNHVILSIGAGFILLAHLRQGSLTVVDGDEVRPGQLLGQVGNSGNTMGPHLHIQVKDGADPMKSNIIPFRLDEYDSLSAGEWKRHEDSSLPNKATKIRFFS